MASKPAWTNVSHEDRVIALRQNSLSQLLNDYEVPGGSPQEQTAYLQKEQTLWQTDNVKTFKSAGGPPTKEVVLGAYRDLDRAEAILELIDNSIDAWLSRRVTYPKATAKELDIYIDIDAPTGRLSYEDNAGGVPEEKLQNLVVPGFSDTTALSLTIGSYKTGGKKAIFRLAMAARLDTRYWSPIGTVDSAHSIHLDDRWISDASEYKFPYAILKDISTIERGQTRYTLQLREEPQGAPWFQSPEQLSKILNEIRTTYSLMLIRVPEIHIYFNNRSTPIVPIDDLYDFTGAHDPKTQMDVRPQRVTYECELDHAGQPHKVSIEIVIGCRTTTGIANGRSWGFDLYGNNRLFVAREQETFAELLPKGNVQRRILGYVNILGPNVFIPWDTHKRHLNHDREIMQILRSHPLIKTLFENWWDAFQHISELARGQGTHIFGKPLPNPFDSKAKEFVVPHVDKVSIDPKRKRGSKLPPNIHVPKVKVSKKAANNSINIRFPISSQEARMAMTYFGLEGDINPSELSRIIRDDVIRTISRSGGRTEQKRVSRK